jgi:hypothetical protein
LGEVKKRKKTQEEKKERRNFLSFFLSFFSSEESFFFLSLREVPDEAIQDKRQREKKRACYFKKDTQPILHLNRIILDRPQAPQGCGAQHVFSKTRNLAETERKNHSVEKTERKMQRKYWTLTYARERRRCRGERR